MKTADQAFRDNKARAAAASSRRRTKPCYLGVPAIFKLDIACMTLHQAFCICAGNSGIYLVGSALDRQDFRDVDVVCMLDDKEFAQLFPDAHFGDNNGSFELDPRWRILTVAISDWLALQIGMPVDFKFQPTGFGNARHSGRRHPLGLRTVPRRQED